MSVTPAASIIFVQAIPAATLGRVAGRPRNSALDTSRLEQLIGRRLRPWREALHDYVGWLRRERLLPTAG